MSLGFVTNVTTKSHFAFINFCKISTFCGLDSIFEIVNEVYQRLINRIFSDGYRFFRHAILDLPSVSAMQIEEKHMVDAKLTTK